MSRKANNPLKALRSQVTYVSGKYLGAKFYAALKSILSYFDKKGCSIEDFDTIELYMCWRDKKEMHWDPSLKNELVQSFIEISGSKKLDSAIRIRAGWFIYQMYQADADKLGIRPFINKITGGYEDWVTKKELKQVLSNVANIKNEFVEQLKNKLDTLIKSES